MGRGTLTIRELGLWDGSPALIIDGGSDPSVRPPVHLQAADGGYLRLVGPEGTLLWGLVDSDWVAVDLVRSKALLHALPPIRADEVDRARAESWTRRFASLLVESSSTPLAVGRRYLFAPMHSVESAPPGMTIDEWHQRKWMQITVRGDDLESLLAQGDEFELVWHFGHVVGLLLTRELSSENDGRVKMWRKRAREGRLPPLVVWWCRGLFAHVLLDGHDRLHAALLDGISPAILVLADVTPHARQELEERRQRSVERTAYLEGIRSVSNRIAASNTVLRAAWDPRLEWDLATPGFPLDGGIEKWEEEVRGTVLAEALDRRRAAAAEEV